MARQKKKKNNTKVKVSPYQNFGSSLSLKIVLAIVCVIILVLEFNPVVFTGGDNGHYISLARSIVHKGTYRTLFKPNSPYEVSIPFGYPILLSLVMIIFPNLYLPNKLLSLIMFCIALYFLYKLFILYNVKKTYAVCIVLFIILSPSIAQFSHWVLTEAPFIAFSFAAIYYLENFVRNKYSSKYVIVFTTLFVFSVYIRIAGAPVLAAVFFYLWIKKDLKIALLFAGISFIFLLPWFVWIMIHSGGGENIYASQFLGGISADQTTPLSIEQRISRGAVNLKGYVFQQLPALLVPQLSAYGKISVLGIIIGLAATTLIILGGVYAYLKKELMGGLYIIFTIAMLLLFVSCRMRYLIGIFPFAILYIIWGLQFIGEKIRAIKTVNYIVVLSLFLIVALAGAAYSKTVALNIHILSQYLAGDRFAGLPAGFKSYFNAAEWLKENSSSNVTVIARKPRLFYLFSDRQAQNYIYSKDPQKVIANIIDNKFDYVVIDQVSQTTYYYLLPAIKSNMNLFDVVYKSPPPETYILRLKKRPDNFNEQN